jgi:anti-anti-sigma factor
MAGLTFETRRDGGVGVVRLKGEARLEEIEPVRREAKALVAAGATRVLFDVGALVFADSASVGVMLEVQREAEGKGGGVALYGASKRFARTLEGMGLLQRLHVVADEAAARQALGA